MKQITRITVPALVLVLGATGAQAACFVEYKAKRDNPLELFHDTVEVGGDCSTEDATARVRERLAREGLTLLKVLSVRKD
ncbi:hypothetical protein [Aquicoccus sp.]|uniref:hypothetical protein n=1 Tax=Aquicoccus sp. TaxID=2055851 RepID=UPI003562210B